MGTSYPHHSSRESVGATLSWTKDRAAIQCGGAGDEGKAAGGPNTTNDKENNNQEPGIEWSNQKMKSPTTNLRILLKMCSGVLISHHTRISVSQSN